MPTLAERAFELARTGDYRTVAHLHAALAAERYENVDALMESLDARTFLRELIVEALSATDAFFQEIYEAA